MDKPFYFDDADDLIDIRYDNVFKAVFTRDNPASKLALSKLVSALIGRNVSAITVAANEPPIHNLRDRRIRFDINCKADNGELINVEMSMDPKPYEPVRLEFYAGKLFTGQDIMGTDKSYDDLQHAYQIAILAKKRFFPDEDFFHVFEYYDPKRRVSLNGRSRIITLELSKLEKVAEKPTEEMSVQEYWAVYLEYLTEKEKRRKINEIMEMEEGIAMASEVLMTISKDEIERMRLMSEYKYQLDTQSALVHAKREGRAEGLAEGLEKGRVEKLEIAMNLVKMGLSVETIVSATGLDIQTITSLNQITGNS
jgi:predicted transposase/invertase (TIGR01784 family)